MTRSPIRRVVLPEAEDARILAAAVALRQADLADPVLLGTRESIEAAIKGLALDASGIEIIDPEGNRQLLEECAGLYARRRGGGRQAIAERAVRKPLYFAACLTALGRVDAMVAGIASPTRRVIEAASLCIGLADGITVPSSFFLAEFPNRSPIVFADCALNVDPSADELAQIAAASWDSASALLAEPARLAMLSFSTHGSASHPRVDKVKSALDSLRLLRPDACVDGELQLDAALSPEVAKTKLQNPGAVAGQANVLIFPDLDAGNIAYKLAQYLGGATMTGPMLQGFAAPVADLSRGASTDDVVRVVQLLQRMF